MKIFVIIYIVGVVTYFGITDLLKIATLLLREQILCEENWK